MVTLLANFAPVLAAEVASSAGRPIPDWARGNAIFEAFIKGGPVMYPIVGVLVVAVAVILERLVWWTVQTSRRDPGKLDKVYAALEQGNIAAAIALARGSEDPLVRTVCQSLNHVHPSLAGALQIACRAKIPGAGRFISVKLAAE
jgi:biopolymer transport protein ExbB